MSELTIPDPRVPLLAEAISDLVAGYAEVRRVLVEEYDAPSTSRPSCSGRCMPQPIGLRRFFRRRRPTW